jgi:DNA mismatch endonuclease (patch repair protein)
VKIATPDPARSKNMAAVRSSGNKTTELLLIAFMKRERITGWRRGQAIFGKPDFLFAKQRVALFVDGCFWHSCPKHSTVPVNNRDFWLRKLTANKTRDRLVIRRLRSLGWRVLRIWEHELERKSEKQLRRRLQQALGITPPTNNFKFSPSKMKPPF